MATPMQLAIAAATKAMMKKAQEELGYYTSKSSSSSSTDKNTATVKSATYTETYNDKSDGYNHWNPYYLKEDGGVSRMTADQSHKYFNLTALPPYEQMPEAYLGHIFMTRPSLYLTPSNMDKLRMLPTTAGLIKSQTDVSFFNMLKYDAKTRWLPVVTNFAKNYNVNDMELKSVDKAETYYGHTIKYGKHNEEYKHGGTISIEFRNDKVQSIMRLMWFWVTYIYNISREDYLEPSFDAIWNGILDYDASLFYLVTKRDGRTLVYWEELVGLHPKRVPLSNYSWNDNMILQDTVSIDFDYNIRRDPLDPGILADINCLSIQNTDANSRAVTRIKSDNFNVINDVYSSGPVIKVGTNIYNEKTYYLEYVPAGNSNRNWTTSTAAF